MSEVNDAWKSKKKTCLTSLNLAACVSAGFLHCLDCERNLAHLPCQQPLYCTKKVTDASTSKVFEVNIGLVKVNTEME